MNAQVLFDDDKHRSIIGKCGHSVCEMCYNKEPEMECVLCSEDKAFVPKKINYAALDFRKEYENNTFEATQKFWDFAVKNIERCAGCSDVQKLKLCSTCNMQQFSNVNLARLYATCDDCAKKRYLAENDHIVMPLDSMFKFKKDTKFDCRFCKKFTPDPKFSVVAWMLQTGNFTRSQFFFCSNCLLDDHKNHVTNNIASTNGGNGNREAEQCLVMLLDDFFNVKMELEDNKCQLRYMRMMMTKRNIMETMWVRFTTQTHEDAWEFAVVDTKLKTPKSTGRTFDKIVPSDWLEKMLSSLKYQYEQLHKFDGKCACLPLMPEINRLNILNKNGDCPFFWLMNAKIDVHERVDVCPYELNGSFEERVQLMDLIITGKRLEEGMEIRIRDRESDEDNESSEYEDEEDYEESDEDTSQPRRINPISVEETLMEEFSKDLLSRLNLFQGFDESGPSSSNGQLVMDDIPLD